MKATQQQNGLHQMFCNNVIITEYLLQIMPSTNPFHLCSYIGFELNISNKYRETYYIRHFLITICKQS